MGNAPNDNDDFSVFTPFNDSSHFHTKCQITDFNNQPQVEVCRLGTSARRRMRGTVCF